MDSATLEKVSLDKTKASPFFSATGGPRVWILYYSENNRPVVTKQFIFDGKMQEAIGRGRRHCEIMGYRFAQVRPFIFDLDFQEKQYREGISRAEGE